MRHNGDLLRHDASFFIAQKFMQFHEFRHFILLLHKNEIV